MNSTPIYQNAAPMSASLEPVEPMILISSYELHPYLVAIGQNQPFSIAKVLYSNQECNELLATLRESYNLLINLGLDLALQDPVLLQHPYTGLDNTAFGRLKDGKSSDAIVGEKSHLEDNPIFSPSMPTLDDFYEPILDSNESSNALSPKPPDNLRNPSRHPTHRNHLEHKEDREEQHQWPKSIKNRYAIAIECVDEALYETNSKGDLREFLDIYVESPLEVENDGDFNKQGNYFFNTPSVPCSYEKSPDSLSLSNIAPHEIFNPLMLPIPKIFKRVVVDTYAYHKYFRSRCGET